MRNLELAGRSPVHAVHGMAATSHPLSTLAAVNMLQDGGNAMDGEVVAFNGSGRAPAAATAERLRALGVEKIVRQSPHAVTVPGAVDAWFQLLRDHGTRDLGGVLGAAIGHARDGYPIHSRVHVDWQASKEVLAQDPTASRIFLPGGEVPPVGALHRQPELAATLERIARDGRDGFYTGPVAQDIVTFLNSLGGLHTLEDFAVAAGEYTTPIKTSYRGHDIYECPPNGQGLLALEILNILSGLLPGVPGPLSPERLHFAIEAARLAYADRDNLLADPAQCDVPVARLLSAAHADAQRARIDPARARTDLPPNVLPVHADTVYISVVDKDRNAVSFINSLFNSFGTGLVSPESGVALQNRGEGFVMEAGHPNCIAPGKRPLHTIIPGMAVRDGRAVMPFGVMGGHYQAMGHAWFLANMLDFGLDVQEAIDLPRIFAGADGPVEVESGIPEALVAALHARGHETAAPAKPIGGGQAIWIDHDEGVLTGGSDPRKDGCAIGY
jgi:gamma-glutamyltranspeptidase / glutathione hydrolase